VLAALTVLVDSPPQGLLSDVKVPREVREKLESPVFELRK
jgi:hypothetical protein